ncbi:cytochrome b/b6 domain protein [Acidimicrobium ferrooxidans DSM 10331]|uniref:Cytochrome bc1 complex cytochrome b subunit n=1 Tax=Acidimicrobium ferrooxidans (strain DSM 10331 / JCM 15462 / NBRC 103882 / ICP) TaxID=525909 RepID=C7M191_ACIFD|nr:ubiquinol-cytochrome c reductase cytochrome b subunit [Acidimicrobium ferrooxidans]ACU54739.1 cytochrome b/b6 domain protein [Acidimicrobium ferrooxidans DSM 10331]
MSTLEERALQAADEIDDRFGSARFVRNSLNKIFPDHWSFMLGEIALYSFVVLIFTGVFLTLFYVPSTQQVIYHGSYAPLRGQRMSEAYASTLNISFNVRAGLVMRQIHHWAADVFIAAIVVHLLRIFFTGAYRKPREINWTIGLTLLVLSIINGFIGYSLPDDLISGTGIRIAFSILLSIPVVGSYLAFFVFGGNYPGTAIIPRFFIIHVLILPAAIAGLIGAHLAIMWHQKHTQYPGRGRTNRNVVGIAFWPAYALQAGGFFFITAAVLAALGGLVQINPIWLYGPYIPYKVSYAVQPDWYMGWLDGALRLMPSWEVVFGPTYGGHMIPNVFFPAVLLPGITFGLLYAWPAIERRFTRDNEEHNICDRPREHPVRTSIGVGVLMFYIVLFFASATDVLANFFDTSLNLVLWTMRVLLIAMPVLAGTATYLLTREVGHKEHIGEPKVPVEIRRTDDGAFAFVELQVHNGHEEAFETLPEEQAMAATQPQSNGHAHEDDESESAGSGNGNGHGRPGILEVPRD